MDRRGLRADHGEPGRMQPMQGAHDAPSARVSASGFYDWRDRAPSKRAMDNAALSQRIERIYLASDRIYGMPKIWHELRDTHDAQHDARWAKVGRNRVARLMRQRGLRGVSRRRGFTITTEVDKPDRCAPDLVNRQFDAAGPNQLWASDRSSCGRNTQFEIGSESAVSAQ